MSKEEKKSNLRVFLSYAASDAAQALRIRSVLLKQPDIKIFTTDTLSAGENWIPKLRRALLESDLFIVLLSPNAVESKWVLYELGAAWGLNKPIIPVVTQLEMSGKVPLVLRDVPLLSIEDLENSSAVNQILERYEEAAA